MEQRIIEVLRQEIVKKYVKSEEEAEAILQDCLETFIKKAIKDANELSFRDFYECYLSNPDNLSSKDFLASEIETIIQETPLSERDKAIARYRYIEMKSEDDIANLLLIDKKTVHSNIHKISPLLKATCKKLYKK